MMHLPLLITTFLVAGTQFPKLTVGQLEIPSECEVVPPGPAPIIDEHEDCPAGYWKVEGTPKKCYKLFLDQCRDWDTAQSKCEAEQADGKLLGAHLAWPGSVPGPGSNALQLRDYILDTFRNKYVWLGARGNGGNEFTWRPTGGTTVSPALKAGSSYWYAPPTPPYRDSQCVLLLATQHAKEQRNSSPYYVNNCRAAHYALCEVPAKSSPSRVTITESSFEIKRQPVRRRPTPKA